jgi:hypothetical protein
MHKCETAVTKMFEHLYQDSFGDGGVVAASSRSTANHWTYLAQWGDMTASVAVPVPSAALFLFHCHRNEVDSAMNSS